MHSWNYVCTDFTVCIFRWLKSPKLVTSKNNEIALKNKVGRFVLATNCLDKQSLSGEDALFRYKDQQGTERGFRFIKDPLFFASSVFLKNTSQIMALALIVYALGEKELRDSLGKAENTVPNQKEKPTNHPTLRWTFQCF